MTTRASAQRRWAAGVVALLGVACASPYEETQPCPSLSYARDVVYVLGGPLALSGDVDGTLPTSGPRFRAHPLAVPPEGGVTLSLRLDLAGGPERPVLYAYGPRDAAGLFGGCTAETVGTALTVAIPEGDGGEWLVLVGADPLDDAKGSYTLTSTCEGDACDSPACPALLASSCTTEVCPTGFTTAAVGALTCPSCTCEQPECGAFRTRVFNTCVCDCQVPLNPAPVCGSDGITYTTACFAGCNEVPVARADGACETECAPLTGCSLDCPNGYVLESGCPTCQCAASCDATPAAWRPVCGTDGLTYVNAPRLACVSSNAPDGGAVAIAYMGACLPNCPARDDCTSSCAYGHQPTPLIDGGTCFSCDCAAPPVEVTGSTVEPFWCGVARLSGAPPSTYAGRLSLIRTFASRDATIAADFKPLFADACPTSGCTERADCIAAQSVLATQLRGSGGAELGVDCGDGKIAGRVCRAAVAATCTSDANCIEGGVCGPSSDGERRCHYDCACLERPNSAVYDPLCAMKDGVPTTYYNTCVANCAGAWPVLYPGECCSTRLSNSERAALFQALLPLCAAAGEHQVPRVFAETACPPSLPECQTTPSLCCHNDAAAAAGNPQ